MTISDSGPVPRSHSPLVPFNLSKFTVLAPQTGSQTDRNYVNFYSFVSETFWQRKNRLVLKS
ncbi:MAG: hypothetical protein HON04_12950 [Planctomicrobium sp.]|nr:hypothetical protein [Planctomicrobium sp.]